MSSDRTIVSYQHTLGASPWLLGRFISNPTWLTVPTGMGLALAWAAFGIPSTLLLLVVAINDMLHVTGQGKVSEPKDLFAIDGDKGFTLAGSTPVASLPASDTAGAINVEAEEMQPEATGNTTLTEPFDPANLTVDQRQAVETSPAYVNNPWASSSGGNSSDRSPSTPAEMIASINANPSAEVRQPSAEERAELLEIGRRNSAAAEMPVRTSDIAHIEGPVRQMLEKEDGYLRSWMLMVPTGGGKGVLAAYAGIQALRHLTGVSIWAVDPKSDPLEYTRWVHIPAHQRYHYNALQPALSKESEAQIVEGIKGILAGYAEDKSPYKILIIDELPAILRSLGKYGRTALKYFHTVASMGRSRNSVVWLFSNAIGLNENGITKQQQSYYRTLYAAIPNDIGAITEYDKFPGEAIGPDHAVFQSTGRAAWTSTKGDWEPVPRIYKTVIDALPQVSPPANFGGGDFQGSQSAIAINGLAEELQDLLLEGDRSAGLLHELLTQTTVGEQPEESLGAIADGLRTCPELVSIRKTAKGYRVSLPVAVDPEEPEPLWTFG